jgi:hypothetical protein
LSDDKDDLELAALQRQLDDAFETTRPRHGYEDELWLRLQARRPFWSRWRDALAGLGGSIRELPAVPAATVAVVLIVAVGIGAIAIEGGFRPGGQSYSATAGPRPADLGAQGRLPTPVLHPGLVDTGVPGSTAFAPNGVESPSQPPSNLYYGPATLTWTGTFTSGDVQAPVLTYVEPGLPAAQQFAASLGASSSKQVRQVNGFLGTYAGADFNVSIRGTVPQLPREPYFILTPSAPVTGDILARYSLIPSWTALIVEGNDRSIYQRTYRLPDGAFAAFVNWTGDPDGIEVDMVNGNAVRAFGQLPLALTPTSYRLITNDAAVRAAVSSGPAGTSAISPTPTVQLSSAQLVYALAVAGGQGYFEPAYLFSGSFQYNGQTYVKRVLVPLVDPSLRS